MDKHVRAAILLDFYGPLLTEKQREIMRLHYEDDLSFSEIADILHITRQGAHDTTRRALEKLEASDAMLGHVLRAERLKARLHMIALLADSLDDIGIPKDQIIELAEISDEELFGEEI